MLQVRQEELINIEEKIVTWQKNGIINDVLKGPLIVASLCLGQGDKVIVWNNHLDEGGSHTTPTFE